MKYFLTIVVSVFLFLEQGFAVTDNTDLLVDQPVSSPSFSYKTFSSCSEFESTMKQILPKTWGYWYGRGGGMMFAQSAKTTSLDLATVGNSPAPALSQESYSKTNTQVLGIDEADTVKTDGKYVYTYQEGEKAIFILDAKTLNKVKAIRVPSNYSNVNFYVTKTKLLLTATKYGVYNKWWYGWYSNEQKSVVALYDITNPEKATLRRTVELDGYLSDSRLEDTGLFTAVVSTSFWTPPIYRPYLDGTLKGTPKYDYSSKYLIPNIRDMTFANGTYQTTQKTLSDCSGIGFVLPDLKTLSSYNFSPTLTTILRFDTSVASSKLTSQVVLSEAGQIHLSRNSLYLTSNMWQPSGTTTCPPNAKCAMPMIWNPGTASTLIHRFALSPSAIQHKYSSLIPGSPISQYSMDEDSVMNFRIVTTEQWTKTSTRLSVLDSNGKLVGKLTDIAPGENFQSSRFIGSRLYLVTFEQIDPFFVIDLSSAQSPKILWELKIPGYSTYLHPYDKDRLIGLWYDTKTNQWWGTQNGGLKVDLYNVSDVKNPKQESSLVIGDAGSSSDALWNPRAFVWYKEKNLLLLPATITKTAKDPNDPYRLASTFQGVVGVSILPTSVSEKFRISHISLPKDLEQQWKDECKQYSGSGSGVSCRKLLDGSEYCTANTYVYVPPYCYAGSTVDTYFANQIWNYSNDFIARVLYIGDSVYTFSPSSAKLWSITNPSAPQWSYIFKVNTYFPRPLPVDIAVPMTTSLAR